MKSNVLRVCILLSSICILATLTPAQGHLGGPLPFGTVTQVPAYASTGQFAGLQNHSPYCLKIVGSNQITSGPFTLTAPTEVCQGGYVNVSGAFDPSAIDMYGAQPQFNYQYIGAPGGVTVQIGASGNYVHTGYINPKYIVEAVIYAPPGGNSFVDYTNSTTVSSTTTITRTFISGTGESVSVTQPGGIFGFLGGSRTNDYSSTLTQQNQDSTSVTASYTDTSSVQVYGPGQSSPSTNCGPLATDYIGVDHDCDKIKVWLNPVLTFTVGGPHAPQQVLWNGYGYSELDTTAPIDIVEVMVGCLNGDIAASDSRCSPAMGSSGWFQRAWAASENWPSGQGPGLTGNGAACVPNSGSDICNLLGADPWGQCTPTSSIGSSACPTYSVQGGVYVLLPPQFTLSDLSPVPYTQGSSQHGWTVSTMNSNTQSQESKTSYKQTWGYEDAFTGSGFLQGFGAKVSQTQTLEWDYEVENKTTVGNTFTGMANITGPACNGNPCNPAYPASLQYYGQATEFDIFVDNFFGTFAFVPSSYN